MRYDGETASASPPMASLEDLLTAFLARLEARNGSPYTIRNYKHDLREFLAVTGIVKAQELDRQACTNYVTWLASKSLAKTSIRTKIYALRSFLKFLAGEGYATLGLHNLLSVPKAPRRLPRYLEPAAIQALLDSLNGRNPQEKRDRAIIETLYATGIRASELLGLRLDDIDLNRKVLHIRGKGGKERMALLSDPATKALADYLGGRRPSAPFCALRVFLNRNGGLLSARGLKLILDKAAKKAGLDGKITPHIFRHTFATHLLGGGADLRVVQELLGHASVATTQIYAHATRSRQIYDQAHPMNGGKNEQ